MNKRAVIAGVGMVPFAKPGHSDPYDVMGSRAARAALDDAGIGYGRVQQAYAGYVYGDSCSGQTALYHVGMTGVPVINVNNNCASGSTAFALAVQAVEHGVVDCALAVGFEEMAPGSIDVVFPQKSNPMGRHLKAVAELVSVENESNLPPAVFMFGWQVELLRTHYGVSEKALARVAIKARRHAAQNPYAVFRDPLTEEQILAGEPIYRGLRKLFACAPTCGAAAVVVCTEAFARQHGIRDNIRLVGKGACSDRAEFFTGDPLDVMFRALTRESAHQAYEDAGVGPDDIDVIELHDCFTSNEVITYSALGLCKDEDMERFVFDDENTYGGKVVVCPSGGLLAKGHPLGATGLAQITELVWQLRGSAGQRQVKDARTALQHNGGLGSAGYVHIFQRQ
ncbi:MAG: lipid-transfer protein [Betaproteobacteria bacterium]|nr:MAG: lipid-transfer protein [Betaproteobacteria bacterium]